MLAGLLTKDDSNGQKTKPETKKAAAGVGMPINPFVCLVSILNLANLSAEKTASENEM